MNNSEILSTKPIDTTRDRHATLQEILRLYNEVLGERGAETSSYYHRDSCMQDIATLLCEILDGGGFDAYVKDYVQQARVDLRQAFRLEPYEEN